MPMAFELRKGLDAGGYEMRESDPDKVGVQIPMWRRFSNLRTILILT